ncbi:MAG: PEGA domain-containing protein [Myxococcales bacterium]|nr:PEGA domain-containing protein [Myxococcales bacterium]
MMRRTAILALVPCLAHLYAAAQPTTAAAAEAGAEVERTLAIVELRSGEVADPLTVKYLAEIISALREENAGDLILVDGKTTADKVRKDRDQVPTAITEERRVQLAEARKKGNDLLDNADFPGAIKALAAAEAKYRAATGAPGADDKLRSEYLDVLAQLATAHVAAGDKAAASEVFRTIITTFGLKAAVTDDNYRPDVVELFKGEVKKVEKMPKGSVEVASNPPGARIILGGNDRGATPFTVADLVPGTYALRLQLGKETSMLHRVKIDGGGVAKVSFDIAYESHLALEDDHVGLMYADMKAAESRIQADAISVGKDVEANMVCAVGVVDGKLVSFLIDVSNNRIVRYANDVKVPKVGISKRAVNKVLVTILGEKADKNVVEGPIGGGAKSAWYNSKPGLAAAGLAVVGLGVGLAFSGNLGDQTFYKCEDPAVKCTNPDEKFAQKAKDAAASAETGQLLARVGLGLGSVALLAAGYFFYAETQKPAEAAAVLYRGLATPPISATVSLPPVRLDSGPVRYLAQ